MNIVTSKQSEKLAEIGAQFKRVREDKELSISHLTVTTLISERYLRAIEDGQMESLPEPVYVRGFIRKYGDALGVGDLSEDFPLNSVVSEQKWVGSAAAELRPLHLYALYVGVIAGAVSLLATLMNSPEASKINDSQTNFSNAAQLNVVKPNKSVDLPEVLLPQLGGLGILKQVIADPAAMTTSPNPSLAAVTPEVKNKSQSEATANPNNMLMAWATNGISANNLSPNSAAIAANGNFVFAGNKPFNVGIVMRGESWMRVTVDGQTEFEGVLNEGKKLAWSGDRQISIRAGNASSVALSYNNQPIKVLGKEGEVAERLFGINQPISAKVNNSPNNPQLQGIVDLMANPNSPKE
ncbi:MAG: DUF4115 domain-containing protein [Pseudanabaena sp. CAN_BIN31]|nr:DUF4115 domain-containing protein [Pseudanabaena sp. CAN_BIN31]